MWDAITCAASGSGEKVFAYLALVFDRWRTAIVDGLWRAAMTDIGIRSKPAATPGSRSTAAIRSSPGVTAAAFVPGSRSRVLSPAAASSIMDAETHLLGLLQALWHATCHGRRRRDPPARRHRLFAPVRGYAGRAVCRRHCVDRAGDHAGPYNAVFCMEVLEHVTDPRPLLADFERLLAPGGTLVISVPIETGFRFS